MKKLRVPLIIFFVLTIFLTSFAQKKEEALRILTNVVGGKTPEEQQLFVEEMERLSGFEVYIVKPPSADYDIKLMTALAGGERYDVVYLTKDLMDILVDQGVLMTLTQIIEESKILSHPAVIPSEEWELIRYPDGEIYGVFTKLEGGTLPIVRGDWMDELGINQPKTLEDFYYIFKAFKENYNAYGLSTAGLYDIQPFMSAAGVKYKYVIDEDGKRIIPYATKEAIPVYEWFAKLYDEGLLDPNFATNDTTKMRELFLTDRVGVITYWDAWVGMFNNIRKGEDPDTSFEARGIPGANGPNGVMLRRGDPAVWAVPINAPNPDLAFQFLEWWWTKDAYILGSLGIEGYDYIVTEEGKYILTEIGEKHNMDHGAPYRYNWDNPVGVLPGVKEAREIIFSNNSTIEYAGPDWPEAEKIVERYAFLAMTGRISAEEAVEQMQKELKRANLID